MPLYLTQEMQGKSEEPKALSRNFTGLSETRPGGENLVYQSLVLHSTLASSRLSMSKS